MATSEDGLVIVRVIAGEALGKQALIETVTPIMYLHYKLQPGGRVAQPLPDRFNVFAYVVEGEGLFGREREKAGDGQMVMFAPDGDEVVIENSSDSKEVLELLLIGGVPLNEPVARYGPFVMNTTQEIYEAIEDYQAGRMGAISF
jgi:redox-sensitive bicupin YhaK (pirin superfamily)